MREQILLYAVLASQLLLISGYLPWRLLRAARHIVDHYPPATYPRLYASNSDGVARSLRRYRMLNAAAGLIAGGLMVAGIVGPGDPLFQWNGGTVVAAFALIQTLPLLIALATGFPYFSMKRLPDLRATRTAQLRPRRALDHVPAGLLATAGAVYLAFAGLVVYVRQFDFAWFGGYTNLVIITGMNLFFAALIFRALYGRPEDPYQTPEDRARSIEGNARVMLFSSIAATLFVGISIGIQTLGNDALDPVAISLYLQVLVWISFRTFRIPESANFEVYREESLAT